MTVLALTKYSYDGPSSRYRFYNYRHCFAKRGIDMTIEPFFNKHYFQAANKRQKGLYIILSYLKRLLIILQLLCSPNKYDLILIEYELFPYLPEWFEYLLRKRDIRYIVDYDDAIFHKYDMHKNLLIRKLLKNKISKIITYANYVIVCNEYLNEYAKKNNKHILRLPTVVFLNKYKKEMKDFQREENDTFTIGWIGSRTTSKYVLDILEVFEALAKKYHNIIFLLVGFDKSLVTQEQIDTCHLNIVEWNEMDEIKNILTMDIGIMPLRDDPWCRGKCGFKLIQYMSCKKSVIASAVGVNYTIIENGINGFLVNDPSEWLIALETLYKNKTLREQMAINNFRKVKLLYNYGKNCNKYAKLIKNLSTKR